MKRIYVSLLACLIAVLSTPVSADGGYSLLEIRKSYLQTAESYRQRANALEVRQASLAPTQQWVAADLIDIYDRMSEIKVELVKAISAEDRGREVRLEQSYHALKAEERLLWDNLQSGVQ